MKKELPISLVRLTMKRPARFVTSHEDGREQMADILRLNGFEEWQIPGYIDIFLNYLEHGKPEGFHEFIDFLWEQLDKNDLGPELLQDFLEIGEATQKTLEEK